MPSSNDNSRAPPMEPGQRIAKVMARAGLASRREAEAWIAAGRVAINGVTITSLAVKVGPKDTVTVDGKPLPQRERTRLFLFHKPRGLVTTTSDPEDRPTIFDALPGELPRLITVGRLDINTEGLLLLTNDGGLARVLEHPQTGWLRRYRVRARGEVTQAQLDSLRNGISIGGIHYGPIEAVLDRVQGANVWLTFAIREGKNREVRNVLGHLDLQVNRLIRVSFGPFQLGDLAAGSVEEVPTRVLREQLGKKIAALADADFDAPLQQRHEAQANARSRDSAAEDPNARAFKRLPRTRFDHKGPYRSRKPPEQLGGRLFEARPVREAQEREDKLKRPRPWRGRMRARPITEPALNSEPRKTTAGLLTDRKGRRVLVQRTRSDPPPDAGRDQHREQADRRRGPPDRRQGPRPSRPRPPKDKR